MAWEWHNRQRDLYGRFTKEKRGQGRGNTAQLHLRMRPEQVEYIIHKARANEMEISEFVYKAIKGFYSIGKKYQKLQENSQK